MRSASLFRRGLVGALLLLATWPGSAGAASATGWQWPLAGVPTVLRAFQPPPTPYAAGHRGVDLAAPTGAAVLAAGAGVVGFAGKLAGRGVVTVLHGPLRTTYEPVSAVVRAGQPVSGGQQIGRLQPPMGHCGAGRPCLHWGLLRGSVYLDPLALVGLRHSILLPVWGRHLPSAGSAGAPPYAVGALAIGTGPAVTPGTDPVPRPTVMDRGPAATASHRHPTPPGASLPAVGGALLLGGTGWLLTSHRRRSESSAYD